MKCMPDCRSLCSVFFVVLLVVSSPLARAEKWMTPTPEELSMTSQPEVPGAAAVYLYREQMTTHQGTLYSVVSDEPVDQAGKVDSLAKMTTLTHAIYDTSRYLLLNNKKKKP